MVVVLKEINGVATEDITDKDGKVVYKKGQPLNTFAHLTDDGKTTVGLLDLHRRHRRGRRRQARQQGRPARKPADEKDYLAHGWGFAWPANRRILYNRASADLQGKPWSEKKKLIWWDPRRPAQSPRRQGQVGRPRRARLQRVPRPRRQER